MYAVKGWKNPFFKHEDKKPQTVSGKYLVRAVAAMMGVVTLASGAYFILTMPAFAFSKMYIEGQRTLSPQRVEIATWHHLAEQKSLYRWKLDAEALRAHLLSTLPLVSAQVATHDNEIRLVLEEQIQFIAVRHRDALWLMTKDGIASRQTTREEIHDTNLIPDDQYYEIVLDAGADAPIAGSSILNSGYLSSLETYKTILNGLQIAHILGIQLTDDAGKVLLVTDLPYAIIFNPYKDAQTQINRMREVLRGATGEAAPTSYVDIRFGERVYVR